MRVFGLTGGIASGKSLVASILQSQGAAIIDADDVYHHLLDNDASLRQCIGEAFGSSFFDDHGKLDRRALGAHVFGTPGELERLNALTHPIIRDEVRRRVEACGARPSPPPVAVVVAPLLYEAGWASEYEAIIVVAVPVSVQKERLMARSNLSSSAADARVASQMSLDEKVRRADFVIDNGGTIAETTDLVCQLFQRLTNH